MLSIPETTTAPVSPPHPHHMCRNRKDTLASDPKPRPSTTATATSTPRRSSSNTARATPIRYSSTTNSATATATGSGRSATTSSSTSTAASLRASLSLPQNPILYPFTDISAATNNFLSKRLSSSSSSSWRCSLRGQDVVIFQHAFRGDPANLPSRLSALCKSHHSSLVKLLGASFVGDHIYLVYEYVAGASLQECLRNPRNPNFTPLSKWMSRMQIATDLASVHASPLQDDPQSDQEFECAFSLRVDDHGPRIKRPNPRLEAWLCKVGRKGKEEEE